MPARMRSRDLRARGEDGLALVLALALVTLLGAFATAVLTVGYSSFKTTEVTRDSNKNLYGADGGADVALQLLRANSTYCPDVSGTPTAMPSQTIGGRTVTLSCQTITGTVGGTGGGAAGVYALVVTGYNAPNGSTPDFNKLVELDGKDKDGSDSVRVTGGHVFNAGEFSFKNDSPQVIFNKNLDQYNGASPYCDIDKAAAASSGQPQVDGTWTCRSPATFPVPDPNPTLIVPTATAPAAITTGDCTVLFPGKYTSDPTFNKDKQYYFASGVYYFANTGEVKIQGDVFGGQPGPGMSQALNSTPCSNDAAANALRPGTASGYGVQFVLGGNAKMTVPDEKKARVELFARVPANPALEGTPGVTIYAPRFAGTNYTAWTSDRAVDIKGKDPQLIIHGLTYMPTSKFDEQYHLGNEDANNISMFDGGVVLQRIKLKFKKDAANLTFARIPETAATIRKTVVTAVATDPTGGAPTTVQAVVQLPATAGGAPTILSWRKT